MTDFSSFLPSLIVDRCACSAYEMTAYRIDGEWKTHTIGSTSIHFQCGIKFGVLYIELPCKGTVVDVCFFSITDYDLTLRDMAPLTNQDGKQGLINFPTESAFHGCCGHFDKKEGVWGFDDEYILDILVHVYSTYVKPRCSTFRYADLYGVDSYMNSFFDNMSYRIRMRTMFKKWYFRAYRKSFAPEKPGRIRDFISFTCTTLCES